MPAPVLNGLPWDDGWRDHDGSPCPENLLGIPLQVVLEGNSLPDPAEYLGRDWYWRWDHGDTPARGNIVRYRTALVEARHLTPRPVVSVVEPEVPTPRMFDCPASGSQCQRAGCTIMHCDTQAERRACTPTRRPAPPRQPTPGPWVVSQGDPYLVLSLATDEAVAVISAAESPVEAVRRANARRIALLPQMEAVVRNVALWNNAQGAEEPDSSGHRYDSGWIRDARNLVELFDRGR